uniref:Uncharacterized protein n=1 Tax=Medicago truncatula TaxID=3880 RepID=I3T2X6_MEDTR|nr:unknown [Medicago truncatula]
MKLGVRINYMLERKRRSKGRRGRMKTQKRDLGRSLRRK